MTVLGLALLPAVASQAFNPRAGAAEAATIVSATLIRTIDTSIFNPASPDPAGITYDPISDRLLVSDSEVDEMTIFRGMNLYESTRTGSGAGFGVTTAYSIEPTGLSYRAADRTLFVADDDADRIFVVRPGGDGRLGTFDDAVTSFQTTGFGSTDAEDVAYDSGTGDLFVIDGLGSQVFRINPGPNGTFGNTDDIRSNFDAAVFGAIDPEGIAVDTVKDTLLLLDHKTKSVYEVTKSGQLQTVISIAAANPLVAAGIVLAPGSRNPSTTSMYIVDRGVDNDLAPNENDGKIYEMQVGGVDLGPILRVQPTNTPPVVDITSPASRSRVPSGTPIRFAATASDAESGDLTPALVWTSSISGRIGTGGSFTVSLPSGHHRITATVVDASGARTSDKVNIHVRSRAQRNRSPKPAVAPTTSSVSATAPSIEPITISPDAIATESVTQTDGTKKGGNKARRK